VSGRVFGIKMVGMAEMREPISLDGVAVHRDWWCVCLCYLHFENPEYGKIYLLVPAHPGCPGHSPESCKMGVCVCVCVCVLGIIWQTMLLPASFLTIIMNLVSSCIIL